MKVKAILEDNARYDIEISLPERDITLEEAKELIERLQAEIEIVEWERATEKVLSR